jgi:alpha-beta hydrolase superfamily lysophospholipase
LPIAALGESLGTSFCVRLAAEHHDLVDAIIIAAPTSKVNPWMYLAPRTVFAGIMSLVKPSHKMRYTVFFNELVSNIPAIREELEADPLTLKRIPLSALLETQTFVSKTDRWAKSIKPDTPVLVLQGSKDKAMVPKAVTNLTKNIKSTDQTIRWISGYGHLLLETDYLGPPVLDAITSFIDDHDTDAAAVRKELYREMKRFGAKDLPTANQ